MKKFLLILVCAFSVAACAVTNTATPVTGSERLVQADGVYKALVATVKDGVLRGSISGNLAVRVKVALASARVALDAWTLLPNDPAAEAKVLIALQGVRTILQSVAPAPNGVPA